jgi:hypothetical protein
MSNTAAHLPRADHANRFDLDTHLNSPAFHA